MTTVFLLNESVSCFNTRLLKQLLYEATRKDYSNSLDKMQEPLSLIQRCQIEEDKPVRQGVHLRHFNMTFAIVVSKDDVSTLINELSGTKITTVTTVRDCDLIIMTANMEEIGSLYTFAQSPVTNDVMKQISKIFEQNGYDQLI